MNCAGPAGCPQESDWPQTVEGETARVNCTCQSNPALVEGLAATRRCLANGLWEAPNEAACEQSASLKMLLCGEVSYELGYHKEIWM